MSYFGIPGGRLKAAPTVNITIISTALTNNATLTLDNGSPTTVTFYPGTWLQLFASLPNEVNFLDIFDSTGATNYLGTGAAASETVLELDYPGGNGYVPILISAGTRFVIQPIVAPTVGTVGSEIDINFWG